MVGAFVGMALLVCVPGVRAMATPEIFEDAPVRSVIERTKGNDKVVIVKATAVWCGPCKRMDATTWVHDSVVSWVRENGWAVEFDVDQQPELARELRVQAMPTMIAFKDGVEFDRIVGYRDAGQFLAWCRDVGAGVTSADKLLAAAGDRAGGKDGRVDIRARRDLARQLKMAGRYDEATDEYVWLWHNMLDHERSFYGVRLSFMVSEMQDLAGEHASAMAAFTKIRDDLQAVLEGGQARTWDNLRDWVAMNNVIGDDAAVLAWFDRIKDRDNGVATLRRMSHAIERVLFRNERYKDLTHIGWDPVADLQRSMRMLNMAPRFDGQMDADELEEFRRGMEQYSAQSAGETLYAAIRGGHLDYVGPILELCDKEIRHVDGVGLAVGVVLDRGAAHESLLAPIDAAIERAQDPTRKESLRKLRAEVLSRIGF